MSKVLKQEEVLDTEELRKYVQDLESACCTSMAAFAKVIGCSTAYLSDFYRGNRGAGPKLLTYLGMKKQITYKRWRVKDGKEAGNKE